jgi:DNA polymerase III alpha subunit
MAVVKVLDTHNTFEAVLFPRAYEKYREAVEAGKVLFFGGRVSQTMGASLQVEEVIEEEAVQRLAKATVIRVPCEEAATSTWPALTGILKRHRGGLPVFVDLVGKGFAVRCRAGNGTKAQASDAFAREVEDLLGQGSLTFDVPYSAPVNGSSRGKRNGYANSGR